jgi:hypothetical protein
VYKRYINATGCLKTILRRLCLIPLWKIDGDGAWEKNLLSDLKTAKPPGDKVKKKKKKNRNRNKNKNEVVVMMRMKMMWYKGQ